MKTAAGAACLVMVLLSGCMVQFDEGTYDPHDPYRSEGRTTSDSYPWSSSTSPSSRASATTTPPSSTPAPLTPFQLPSPKAYMATARSGSGLYMFGGYDSQSLSDQIVRMDVETGTVEILKTKLPRPLALATAIEARGHIYIFGGGTGEPKNPWPPSSQVLRFDPGTGQLQALNERLPSGRWGMSGAWSGEQIYLFGGFDGARLRDILAFDPATGRFVSPEPPAAIVGLPSAREHTAAAWLDGRAYIIGGHDGGSELDEIVEFDPTTGLALRMDVRLDQGIERLAVLRDPNARALLFIGGENQSVANPTTYRFTPSDPSLEPTTLLPDPARWAVSVAATPTHLLVAGGVNPDGFHANVDRLRF